jgi:hypothetical protein
MDDPEQAEKLIRNLARRLERDAPGVSQALLEGLAAIWRPTRVAARLSGGIAACIRSVAGQASPGDNRYDHAALGRGNPVYAGGSPGAGAVRAARGHSKPVPGR